MKDFKYVGSDSGLMYKYFYCPLAIWCVDHTPKWIAPNVITLVGFMFTVGPFIYMFTVYGTQFGLYATKIDHWFYLVIAVTYFFARLLDEMDGK
jgi:ethanolaminephosphotransferase